MGGVGTILSGAVDLADLDVDSGDVVRRSSRFEGFEDDSEDEDVIRDLASSGFDGDVSRSRGAFSRRAEKRRDDRRERRSDGFDRVSARDFERVSARFRAGDVVSVPVARAVYAAPTDRRGFDDDEENASPREENASIRSARIGASTKSRSPPRIARATFTSRDVHDDDASRGSNVSREPLGSMLRDERRGRGSAENRENSAAALLADLERARRRVGRGFGVGGWDGPGTRSRGGRISRPGTAPARRRATPAEEEEEEEDEWMRKMRLRVEQRRREMFRSNVAPRRF